MIKLTLQDRSDAIQRKLDAGQDVQPSAILKNTGLRRTTSKRDLLKAIDDAARQQGRDVPFKANF
jgi:hypothetical protein